MSWANATVSSYAQRHLQTQHTKKRSEGRRGEGKEEGRGRRNDSKRWGDKTDREAEDERF